MVKLELPPEIAAAVEGSRARDELSAELWRTLSQLSSATKSAFTVMEMAKQRKEPEVMLAAIDRIAALSELRGRLVRDVAEGLDFYATNSHRKANAKKGGTTSEPEDRREEEQRRQSSKKQRPAPAEAAGYTANGTAEVPQELTGG